MPKKTYHFKEPTSRSHPICARMHRLFAIVAKALFIRAFCVCVCRLYQGLLRVSLSGPFACVFIRAFCVCVHTHTCRYAKAEVRKATHLVSRKGPDKENPFQLAQTIYFLSLFLQVRKGRSKKSNTRPFRLVQTIYLYHKTVHINCLGC